MDWHGTPANLVPGEHDALAWFAAEELTTLELADDSYRVLLETVLRRNNPRGSAHDLPRV
jgi:hypothetical protein